MMACGGLPVAICRNPGFMAYQRRNGRPKIPLTTIQRHVDSQLEELMAKPRPEKVTRLKQQQQHVFALYRFLGSFAFVYWMVLSLCYR